MNLINSFKFALRGMSIAFHGQPNMKIHLIATLGICVTGFFLDFNYVDWCIVIINIGVVLGAEIINTSVEEIVDFIIPEKRSEAERIKDLSAGAVLMVSVAALIVGIVLIISKISL